MSYAEKTSISVVKPKADIEELIQRAGTGSRGMEQKDG